jgi:uncharacterized cupredoxin-like copper-binding protein
MRRSVGVYLPALAVAAVAVLVAAGCGGGNDNNKASTTTPVTTTKTTTAGKAGAKLSLSADPGGALAFSKKALQAKAGKVTLVMDNPSSTGLQHGIAVEGNGVDKDGAIVGPGKKSTLTVDLKPGKYEFYCPFDGHKAAGMEGTLTVK